MQSSSNHLWQKLQELFHSDSLWVEISIIIGIMFIALLTARLIISYLSSHRFSQDKSPSGHFIVEQIRLPISVSIVLFTLAHIFTLTNFSDSQLLLTHDVFRSIDILVWGQFFYRSSRFYLKRLSEINAQGSIIKPQTLPLLENISAVIIILFIVYLLFITWEIDMTAWLASAGIIGIAVGFAAKDTVANLLSGVFILADSPYKIGDYIVIDTGERGKVTHIGLRSTRILTRDDLEVNIPNAIIANGKIVNESGGRDVKSRIRVPVGVAYGSDIDLVSKVLVEVAQQEPEVCKDPEPRTRFRQFGASSLDFELLIWINDPEIRGRVKHSLNFAIYKRFAQENIEIPFSQHDVYIKSLPENVELTPEEIAKIAGLGINTPQPPVAK
ncbi:mechanosensitive ion channel family protein [Thiomicrorhabdus indica]|uniref:mechanosensitive ion channel family protein n=1 Tax=Thiomicrorhabdus indica TaxID=2267253 RepID=UPI002AA66179|nr:mechanosensitive ion channel domain-containing protein [Thiomicrorhabdus indica]